MHRSWGDYKEIKLFHGDDIIEYGDILAALKIVTLALFQGLGCLSLPGIQLHSERTFSGTKGQGCLLHRRTANTLVLSLTWRSINAQLGPEIPPGDVSNDIFSPLGVWERIRQILQRFKL